MKMQLLSSRRKPHEWQHEGRVLSVHHGAPVRCAAGLAGAASVALSRVRSEQLWEEPLHAALARPCHIPEHQGPEPQRGPRHPELALGPGVSSPPDSSLRPLLCTLGQRFHWSCCLSSAERLHWNQGELGEGSGVSQEARKAFPWDTDLLPLCRKE